MALNEHPHSQPDLQKGSVSWAGELRKNSEKKVPTNITIYYGRVSASRSTVLASSRHRHFAKN